MSLNELSELLSFLRERYDSKWYVAVLTQFCLGLRASELLSIQIMDFKDKFRLLDYRQAKTNKMIYNEPVPDYLSKLIINYCYYNQHRFKDGYLFCTHNGKGPRISVETYGAFWSKWRKGIAKKNPRWLDRYPIGSQVRYRIGSHSLRRLHRTVLRNNIQDLYIVKELCNYQDYSTLERYINTQEIIERKADYLLPVFNPIVNSLTMASKGQITLKNYMEGKE